ncbi:MAG TPA: hypothetical protein VML75_27665 [Kofleriaceae bacterium]|nr:hypothetical protein [Kofleriaceae bacterium]
MIHRLALVVLFAVGASGCFDRPKPECAFLCGEGDACPDGYACATDGWCKRVGVDPTFDCTGGPVADASVTDGQPADAAVDASVIDAPPTPDASTPDATVDAMPPDADPPDADPPDADPPDAFVNTAPTLTVPGDKPRAIAVSVQDTFTVTASDPDVSQTVTLSAGFPSGSTALNPFEVTEAPTFTPATGVFDWTPPAGSEGTYEVEFTATDDHTTPASDSEILIIIVQ